MSSRLEPQDKAGPARAAPQQKELLTLSAADGDDVVTPTVDPPVTVVLEGRSICHRVHLHSHAGYESLALELRRLFSDGGEAGDERLGLDLSNAVPGYVVAYEDMEDDLLLVGDLNWNDFVRVAKRIRIIPAKKTARGKQHSGM